MLDIDRYKEINHSYGHQNAVRAVQLVAAALQVGVREGDIYC